MTGTHDPKQPRAQDESPAFAWLKPKPHQQPPDPGAQRGRGRSATPQQDAGVQAIADLPAVEEVSAYRQENLLVVKFAQNESDQPSSDAAEVARLKARIRELEARIHRLEEALRPFTGTMFFSDALDDEVWELPVRVADLRRAREALYGKPRWR